MDMNLKYQDSSIAGVLHRLAFLANHNPYLNEIDRKLALLFLGEDDGDDGDAAGRGFAKKNKMRPVNLNRGCINEEASSSSSIRDSAKTTIINHTHGDDDCYSSSDDNNNCDNPSETSTTTTCPFQVRTLPTVAAATSEKSGLLSFVTTTAIEIKPGVHKRLRRLEETRECIASGFFLPSQCSKCLLEMCCIEDASYVICPDCRAISPAGTAPLVVDNHKKDETNKDEHMNDGNHINLDDDGGVTLGFTIQTLQRFQSELEEENDQNDGEAMAVS